MYVGYKELVIQFPPFKNILSFNPSYSQLKNTFLHLRVYFTGIMNLCLL